MKKVNALKQCILKDGPCQNCGECDRCDLDRTKICNNCGKCIAENAETRAIKIDSVIMDL